MSSSLTSTVGLIAIAAGAGALLALLASVTLTFALRRVRRDQRAVLGSLGRRDLVAHGVELGEAFTGLRDYVEDVLRTIDSRVGAAEQRLDGAIAHRALVRYDAYNEMSGHQSLSIALLDATRSGVVLTSIHHRDQARLYAKQVHAGEAELCSPPRARGARARTRRVSVTAQATLRVGYLGPQGTFSHQALRAAARPAGGESVGLATLYDTVMAVNDGIVDLALVPIENALEGSVDVTLDTLAADAAQVTIVGETVALIRTCLITARPLALERIETVYSHPQPNAQCARFLRRTLPGAQVIAVSSTAEAVRDVTSQPQRPLAALGNQLAAELYGGEILIDGVDDVPDNATRFVWLTRTERAAELRGSVEGEGDAKTSIVFWGAGDESPGWLVGCLGEFAQREVSLTRIESRPRRIGLGHYMFFADLRGSTAQAPPRGGDRAARRALPGGSRARLLPLELTGAASRSSHDSRERDVPRAQMSSAPPTPTSAVRVARRAPATRAGGWPGARAERDV